MNKLREEVTILALECLKIDLERLRLKVEADKIWAETMNAAIPDLRSMLISVIEGKKLSPEAFLEFVKGLNIESLESVISDLQKLLEEKGGE